ncbi:hypothetical protein [Klebsiella aerogenes]|uniref:hypothetical protein n=1 Tax=Klebsiella aerogenes TaxID=548 RepID=UPI002D7FA20B|nr:hypothetical protein [Klebsiella aerogenes]
MHENIRIYKIHRKKEMYTINNKNYNVGDMGALMNGMSLDEYGKRLEGNVIVNLNSDGVLVDSRTGVVLATNGRQLDLLIAWMETLRQQMMK